MGSCRLGRLKCFVANMARGSRVKFFLWPFCARIPGPTDTIWASFLVGLGDPTLKKKNSSAMRT